MHSSFFDERIRMYRYYFKLANLVIQINAPFVIEKFYEMEIYRIEYAEKINAQYTIEMFPENWKIEGKLLFDDRKSKIYETKETIQRYFFWSVHTEKKYVMLSYSKKDFSLFKIYLQKEYKDELLREFHISGMLAMELVFIINQGFQLHASVINWKDKGILFSAPSGTEKSTKADLWKKYEGAKVINGDRALIRKEKGEFTVYGSPYAGTSKIYTNFSAPIKAIVILDQGKENKIKRLGVKDAFVRLYSESTVNAWNQEYVIRFLDLLQDLIENVPVYHLSCRPDQDAVNTVKNEILKEL